jgi:hypothetical protein
VLANALLDIPGMIAAERQKSVACVRKHGDAAWRCTRPDRRVVPDLAARGHRD